MATPLLIGRNDTIILNSRLITDLANESVMQITLPNDVIVRTAAKDGNVVFSVNEEGYRSEITLRVLLGSADDKFLNGLCLPSTGDITTAIAFPLIVTKIYGDGTGSQSKAQYTIENCMMTKTSPDYINSTTGDVNQGISEYSMVGTFLSKKFI